MNRSDPLETTPPKLFTASPSVLSVFGTVSLLLLVAAAPSLVAQELRTEVLAGQAAGAEEHVHAMTTLHGGEEPSPTPAATSQPKTAVSGERIAYGGGATGYLAKPDSATGPLPGLIVIHEWWGLNENIESMARRLAGEGYLALAVDLYGGKVATTSQEAMGLMRQAMSDTAPGEANLDTARKFLEQRGATKIGVVGWCFGGAWSLQAALSMPKEIDAAVIYYGRLITDEARLSVIEAPILGLFGAEDSGIPVASVRAFESALSKLGKSASIHVYEGADHAFANPSGERYNETAATDAWGKTVAFFAQHLR